MISLELYGFLAVEASHFLYLLLLQADLKFIINSRKSKLVGSKNKTTLRVGTVFICAILETNLNDKKNE